jgi:predicted glycosyl hydrolase (DUF1957 family)
MWPLAIFLMLVVAFYWRFLHQRRRMAQRGRSSVQRQFHQKRHLAQHWVRDAVLVEWLGRNS